MPQLRMIRTRTQVPQVNANIGTSSEVSQVASAIGGLLGSAGRMFEADQAEGKREQARVQAERDRQAEQLANNEAMVATINAESSLSLKAAEYMRQRQEEPGGMAGMTADVLKEFDGWAKEAGDAAPAAAKPRITQTAARLRGDLNLKAFGAETTARQSKVVDDFGGGLDEDRRLVFADPAQFQAAAARRVALANTLAIPEAARSKLAEEARSSLAFEAASAMAERDPDALLRSVGVAGGKTGKDGRPLPSDPAKAAEAVRNDPVLSNLPPDKLRQVVDRATMFSVQREASRQQQIEQQQRRAEAAAAKREREATTAYTILSTWTREGKTADPAAAKPLLDRIAGTPYAAAYAAQAADVQSSTAAAMLPISTQRAQIDALVARRNASGTNEQLEHEINARQTVLSATQRDYQEDPLRAGLERGIIPSLAPLNTGSLDSIVAGAAPRVQQAASIQMQAGRPVSPFTADEAAQIGELLSPLSIPERSRRVAQLAGVMQPGQAAALAAQVDKKDRALALQIATGTDRTNTGRFTGEWIARGAQAIKDKSIKEDSMVATGLRAQIAAEIGDSLTGRAREDVIDAARLAFLGQQSDGRTPSIKGIVSLAMGADLMDFNGRRVPVPAGWTDSQMRAALPVAGAKAVGAADMVLAGGKPLPRDEFLRALPGAQLEPAGLGRYAVRAGGALVTTADRQPIILDLTR